MGGIVGEKTKGKGTDELRGWRRIQYDPLGSGKKRREKGRKEKKRKKGMETFITKFVSKVQSGKENEGEKLSEILSNWN